MRIGGPLEIWREEVGRRYLNLDFKPSGNHHFEMAVDVPLVAEGLRVGRVRHSPGATFRDRELIERDADEGFVLFMPRRCNLHFEQKGRSFEVRGAEAAFLFNCDPGSVGTGQRGDYHAVIVPEPVLAARDVDCRRLVGRPWHRSGEAFQLFKKYIAMIEGETPYRTDAVRSAMARHLMELVTLALSELLDGQPAQPAEGLREARLLMAQSYIQQHFANPGLTLSTAAADQGVSPRYLYGIFEEAGLRFVAMLNELRLANAYADLLEPALADVKIADIAYRNGFSDISHFNRLFRARFDATPSAIRTLMATRQSP